MKVCDLIGYLEGIKDKDKDVVIETSNGEIIDYFEIYATDRRVYLSLDNSGD